MRIDIITLFPQMVEQLAAFGVTGRAATKGLLKLRTWNPREFTMDRHRSVDDRPYGGGPGMVMMVQPLRKCIRAARSEAPPDTKTIYLSPQGKRLDQHVLREWAQCDGIILVAGRYEGVDERLMSLEIDEEWSLGDYVLSGGELAALVVVDGVSRLLPRALGDANSAQQDSFMDGLLDYPHYTRPAVFSGLRVPQTLLEGHHGEIRRWRLKQALGRTHIRRPDLLRIRGLNADERGLLDEFLMEQMHREGSDSD